jgi:TonB family protein
MGPIEAGRDDPYFRLMYQRVDRAVVFPPHLAAALEQGEVVVRFTLHADGRIGPIAVAKPSGFDDFDRELVRALEVAAPFGEVPAAVLGNRDRVTVVASYTFRNPLIR